MKKQHSMFEKISIIGRVAYTVYSLEIFLKEQNYDLNDWKILLDALWSFSEMDYVDAYTYKVIECQPSCILEFPNYHDDDHEYISENEFLVLQKLYKECPQTDVIDYIMEQIQNMLSVHLYTTNVVPAQYSLEIMENDLYPYLKSKISNMPPTELFEIYSVYDVDCWGKFCPKSYLLEKINEQ